MRREGSHAPCRRRRQFGFNANRQRVGFKFVRVAILLVRRRLPFHEPESPAAWMGSAVDVRPRVSLSPISSLSEDSDEAAELTGNLDDGTLLRDSRPEKIVEKSHTPCALLERKHGAFSALTGSPPLEPGTKLDAALPMRDSP